MGKSRGEVEVDRGSRTPLPRGTVGGRLDSPERYLLHRFSDAK